MQNQDTFNELKQLVQSTNTLEQVYSIEGLLRQFAFENDMVLTTDYFGGIGVNLQLFGYSLSTAIGLNLSEGLGREIGSNVDLRVEASIGAGRVEGTLYTDFLARKLYATSIDIDFDHYYRTFPAEDFKKIPVQEIQEFFIGLLLGAIELCSHKYEIPTADIEMAINKFRDSDYKTKWIFKRKKVPGTNLKCVFSCEWTIAYFCMVMDVYNGSEKVLSENVMYTTPW